MVNNIQFQRKADPLALKPVQTTAIQHHALFGPAYVRQHMMVDDGWKNEDLIDEYKNVTELLRKHLRYQELEKKQRKTKLYQDSKQLRQQVQVGRMQLQMAMEGDIQHELRLILANHKDMQRLYAKMSLGEVVENITQRTFTIRKEHDRWQCHLRRLGKEMENRKMDQAHLENRLHFQNEFFLREELASRELHKQVQNSQARLQSMQTINSAYKKMVLTLKHDEKFHEPILDSLSKDIEDQQSFINHIIHVGAPAIERLKELKHESWMSDENKRQQRQSKRVWITEMNRVSGQAQRVSSMQVNKQPLLSWKKRYVRETSNMLKIKNQLMEMEKKIRQLQEATLCSRPETIYPTFKQQTNLNTQLEKKIALQELDSSHLKFRIHTSFHKRQSLLDEFSGISQKREDYINHLNELIAEEDLKESQCLNAIEEHCNTSVVLRCFLWNVFDILRHVHLKHESHIKPSDYLDSYMKLPLLKYEHLEMKAVPPQNFEKNTTKVLNLVSQKLEKLMAAHQELLYTLDEVPQNLMADLRKIYCNEYIAAGYGSDDHNAALVTDQLEEKSLAEESPKQDVNIPTSSFIKDLSAKLLEAHLKLNE